MYAVEKAVTGNAGGAGLKAGKVGCVTLACNSSTLEAEAGGYCFMFEDSLGNLVLLYFEFYSQTLKKKDCFVPCVNNFLYNRLGSSFVASVFIFNVTII